MSRRDLGLIRNFTFGALAAIAVIGAAAPAAAGENLTAVITVRGDSTLTVTREKDGGLLIVDLNDSTKIRSGGKKMSASNLIPGLRVKLAGDLNANNRLVAERIEFTHEDQKIAQAVRAGLVMTQQQMMANVIGLADLAGAEARHAVTLDTHEQTLQRQAHAIEANDLKVVGTTGALAARIDNLDDFNVVDTLIVYFKDGQTDVSKDSAAQLRAFGAKAKAIDGYRLQVQGYASAVGPDARNDALSLQRAHAVTGVLLQQAAVPPTHVFVPAGMGVSEQVADNKTAKGQSQNRRVIVTILQSKGLAHP
jgi:outer membrane protein OmpA-like peptidoglycan-associated protein